MKSGSGVADDSGITLIVTLLIMMLMAALMAGFFAAVNADTRSNALDKDQTRAYAAAHAGLEKLTSDLAALFGGDVSPSVAQINALLLNPPVIPGFEFRAPGGVAGSGYTVSWKADGSGNPAPDDPTGSNITAGPYKGFKGIITKYPITITARSTSGGAEVRLRREVQTVAVPVFQFGVFSETDLTFYAGDPFNFGGRVHTNGHLFMCTYANNLQFSDRITAVGEVVRANLSNGLTASSVGCTATVNVPVTIGTPNTYRALNYSPNEGSVTGMPDATAPGTAQLHPNPNWTTLSTSTYKSNIRTTLTGVKKLTLPIVSQSPGGNTATPRDLIIRPAASDDTVNPAIYPQRYYTQASLRILLSDRSTDISTLPGITGTAPIPLNNWRTALPTGIIALGPTFPPLALSPGAITATQLNGNPTSSGSPVVWSIPVAAIPAIFQMPTLTAGAQSIICTGKTTNAFTGCTTTATVVSGTNITATLSQGSYTYPTVNAATSTAASTPSGAGTGRTITVGANQTLPYSRNFFWTNGTATGTTPPPVALVSCTGYTTTAFTGCVFSTADSSIPPGTNTYDPWFMSTNAVSSLDEPLLGGFIKIEKQSATGVWTDVTAEILNLGVSDKNQEGTICQDPDPDAVIRIQRLRDNGGICDYSTTAANSQNPYDYWPNALYDTREGNYRDVPTVGLGSAMTMGGVMSYITLDVGNLKKWLAGTTGATGTTAWNNGGYIVYFSDRRGNHNPLATVANAETGEYGFEDVVNPLSAAGVQNHSLDTGEDFNGNGALDRYGETPSTVAGVLPTGSPVGTVPFGTTVNPWTAITGAYSPGQARVNKQVLFRRALKLQNGGIASGVNSIPTAGLTVVTENPVYVQGNWNSNTANAVTGHVPSAIIADAVTLLSNNYSDAKSMKYPNDPTGTPMGRDATTTSYRFAVVAGKSLAFPYPTAGTPNTLFGTDGGVGNFLHLLENWNISGVQINYTGSIVSLYYSRQATGTFKYGNNVYDFGTRNFIFDTDFLLPSLLPPGTPMFRDINTLTFRQILRPTQ